MKQLRISQQITKRESRSFSLYLNDISSLESQPLSAQEEAELAKKIRNSKNAQEQKAAIDKLCRANLRFVVSVAKQYQGQGLPLNELVNEGNLGLIKAAHRFDETKGFKFISYAVWWIRQAIMESIALNSRSIRLPLNKITELNKVKKIRVRLQQREGREVTTQEIIREMAMEEMVKMTKMRREEIPYDAFEEFVSSKDWSKTVKLVEEQSQRIVSTDSYLSADDQTTRMIDMVESDGYQQMDNAFHKSDTRMLLEEIMENMPERERIVIENSFGFNGQEPKGNEEIGRMIGISAERVRQLREKALRRLKINARNSDGFQAFMS